LDGDGKFIPVPYWGTDLLINNAAMVDWI